jgi:hypothetical protein
LSPYVSGIARPPPTHFEHRNVSEAPSSSTLHAASTPTHVLNSLSPRFVPAALQPISSVSNASYLLGGLVLSAVLSVVAASMALAMWRKQRARPGGTALEPRISIGVRSSVPVHVRPPVLRPDHFVPDPHLLAVPPMAASPRKVAAIAPLARRPSPLRTVFNASTTMTSPPRTSAPAAHFVLPRAPEPTTTAAAAYASMFIARQTFATHAESEKIDLSASALFTLPVYNDLAHSTQSPATTTTTADPSLWNTTPSLSSTSSVGSAASSSREGTKSAGSDSDATEIEVMSGFQIRRAHATSYALRVVPARHLSIDAVVTHDHTPGARVQPLKAALAAEGGRRAHPAFALADTPMESLSSKSLNLSEFPAPPLFSLPGVSRSGSSF